MFLTIGPANAEKKTIKVGAAINLTGPASSWGQFHEKGQRDYFRYVNEVKGGVAGHKIDMITVDTAYKVPEAQAAVQKFVLQDKVDMIATWGAGEGLAAKPIVQKYKVPTINYSTSWEILEKPVDYMYLPFGSYKMDCQAVLEYIKLSIASLSLGIGLACMEISTALGKSRQAFGKPIGLFEGVGAKLAVMFTNNDLSRLLTLRAAWSMEQKEAESAILTSCAKLFASEAVNTIADLAMQVHGGHGYIRGTQVERLYRDARFAVIAYGTSELQRAAIAKDCLDKFKAA